jgi:hypothetical protein
VSIIGKALLVRKSVRTLGLAGCKAGPKGAEAIADVRQRGKSQHTRHTAATTITGMRRRGEC